MAVAQTCRAKLAQLFCFGMVRVGEHAACGHRRRSGNGVPYSRKRRSREDQENRERSRRLRVHLSVDDGLPRRKCFPAQTEGNKCRRQNTFQ